MSRTPAPRHGSLSNNLVRYGNVESDKTDRSILVSRRSAIIGSLSSLTKKLVISDNCNSACGVILTEYVLSRIGYKSRLSFENDSATEYE